MNRFPILLKREYWEHRGGFVWAPVGVPHGVVTALERTVMLVGISQG